MKATIKDGGSAFPVPPANFGPAGDLSFAGDGMSLRDYFAAKALNGWLAGWPDDVPCDTDERKRKVATFCYEVADAMLKARDQ